MRGWCYGSLRYSSGRRGLMCQLLTVIVILTPHDVIVIVRPRLSSECAGPDERACPLAIISGDVTGYRLVPNMLKSCLHLR